MKESVYIETTIISYLTGRPSGDVLIKAHQELTQIWWERRAPDFTLCSSQFVIDEAATGDVQMAAARLRLLNDVKLLKISPQVATLADLFACRSGTSPQGTD
jgi:hypothetical protein